MPDNQATSLAHATAPRCAQCKRDAYPGERLCAHHKETARRRRRRYDERMREAAGRSWDAHMQRVAEERDKRSAVLIAWAAEHGRVPTLGEVADLLGYSNQHSSSGQIARRQAFGLRPLRGSEASFVRDNGGIPFPVPTEYLERHA